MWRAEPGRPAPTSNGIRAHATEGVIPHPKNISARNATLRETFCVLEANVGERAMPHRGQTADGRRRRVAPIQGGGITRVDGERLASPGSAAMSSQRWRGVRLGIT